MYNNMTSPCISCFDSENCSYRIYVSPKPCSQNMAYNYQDSPFCAHESQRAARRQLTYECKLTRERYYTSPSRNLQNLQFVHQWLQLPLQVSIHNARNCLPLAIPPPTHLRKTIVKFCFLFHGSLKRGMALQSVYFVKYFCKLKLKLHFEIIIIVCRSVMSTTTV